MAERGSYRAVKTVLLDGPDFQDLPERPRWVFVALKLSFGPSGIEVHYPEALAHVLAEKTGAPLQGVRDALDALEEHGWIRRERNILWIVGQLNHDPSLDPRNSNHRKSIQRHVAGLPRLGIVRAFIEEHREWFEDTDSPTDGLPMATEWPSIATAITEDRIPSTEDGIPKTSTVAIATGADAPPNGTPPSRPAPPPIDRIDDREQRRSAYLQTFMPVLREVGLHDDGTNGSIIKALADKRAPPTGMEEAIRGLALVMPDEMPGGELKLLYATKRDDIAEPMWNRAKRAYMDSIKGEVSPLVREMTG